MHRIQNDRAEINLRFGGGVNNRASADQISPFECEDGVNFNLEFGNTTFSRRGAIDLKGTATNGEEIRGYAQLEKSDGTRTTLIQAGGDVYSWDGSNFTDVGNCTNTALLRGPLSSNHLVDDVVIITDLNGDDPVYSWNGTAFSNFTHNLGGTLKAKYATVENERLILANIDDNGAANPHLIVGSNISNISTLDTTNRTSSSLGEGDAWYLPTPDLRPVNGVEAAFGRLLFSTREGKVYQLLGDTAKDFYLDELAGDAASGIEALVRIGNDLAIGRNSKIDTLSGSERFGDVETDDLTRPIPTQADDATTWQMTFNSRTQRLYAVANGGSEMLVLEKSFLDARRGLAETLSETEKVLAPLSPWMVWRSTLGNGFQTNCLWTMKDPVTGLLTTYMGGPAGQIYALEGTGTKDGGTADITCYRASKRFRSPDDGSFGDMTGTVDYKRDTEVDLSITLEEAGDKIRDTTVAVLLEEPSGTASYYSNGAYYSGSAYYGGTFRGRLASEPFSTASGANQFQIRTAVTGANFQVEEIKFQADKS